MFLDWFRQLHTQAEIYEKTSALRCHKMLHSDVISVVFSDGKVKPDRYAEQVPFHESRINSCLHFYEVHARWLH